MEKTVAGFPVEELKNMGLTSADVEYIREKSLTFKNKIDEPGKVTQTHGPESVKAMVHLAFEQGIAVGIAKVRGLAKAEEKIGF
jgi:hypothetical protein